MSSEEPFRGDGMTEAVRMALKDANLKLEDLAWRLTDITQECYKSSTGDEAATPGYPLKIIRNAGHLSNCDNPDDVNAIIAEFVEQL